MTSQLDELSIKTSCLPAVEAGAPLGWHRYAGDCGDVLGVEMFGSSAPDDVVMRE